MSALDASKKEIKTRISELKSEITRLESALKLLGGEEPPSRSTRRSKRKKSTATRAPRGQRKKQVVAVISEHPGIKASQIARDCDMLPSAVHPILKKLVETGAVEKSDDKGYHLPSK